jgi:acetyltransferase-like isoleucine patch superfamily enzyme
MPADKSGSPAGVGRPREIARAQDQLFRQPGGARAKYSALIVGRPGLGALLKYELVVLIAQPVPGALGLALRKTMYRWLLGRHPHKIHIADNVVIDDGCLLDAKGTENRGIRIGSGVFIGRNTILSCKNGDITLDDGANVGFNCEIFSAGDVQVGKDTLMAAYSYLVGGDHDFSDRSIAVNEQPRKSRGIRVGAGVWIGAGATVLDGVTIGDRAIIGAHAVVREAVPEAATAAGVPAKIISGGDAT